MQARKKEKKKTLTSILSVVKQHKFKYVLCPLIEKTIYPPIPPSTDRYICVRLCRISSHHAEMITTCHVGLSLSYVTGLISPAYPWRSNREPSPCNFLCMRAKGRGEQMRPLPRRPSGSQPLPPTTGSSRDESPPHIFPCHIWILLGYFTTSTWAPIYLPLLLSPSRFTQGYTAMCMFYVWFKWAVFYKFRTLTPKISCTCLVICWTRKGSSVRYIIYMWWVTRFCICRF